MKNWKPKQKLSGKMKNDDGKTKRKKNTLAHDIQSDATPSLNVEEGWHQWKGAHENVKMIFHNIGRFIAISSEKNTVKKSLSELKVSLGVIILRWLSGAAFHYSRVQIRYKYHK